MAAQSSIDPESLEFDCPLPDYFNLACPICLGLLLPDEPRLVTCCGKHFCRSCIESVSPNDEEGIKRCPLCKADKFQSVPDKNHLRALKALKVLCTQSKSGCTWKGELGDLMRHLSREGDCEYVMFDCIKCGVKRLRSEMLKHEQLQCDLCPKLRVSDALLQELIDKVGVLASNMEVLVKKVEHLENEVSQLKNATIRTATGNEYMSDNDDDDDDDDVVCGETRPFYRKITDVKSCMRFNKYITSRPFYYGATSHRPGYMMKAYIYVNGFDAGMGTHVSVYIRICSNANDHLLKWPFSDTLTIRLKDQLTFESHYERVMDFEDAPFECKKKPAWGTENAPYGFGQFIAHDLLSPCYLVDNTLLLEIPEIQVRINTY